MELERASITGRTFSRAADGYDPEEVDSHLAAIAEAAEAQSRGKVGEEAGEELGTIVEGAQQSAAALRERAEREARELTESAQRDARAARERAGAEARAQVAAAGAAVKGILERVEALRLGIEEAQRSVSDAGAEMAGQLGGASEPLLAVLEERATALRAEIDLMGTGLSAGRGPLGERAAGEQGEESGTGLLEGDLAQAEVDLGSAEPPEREPAATRGPDDSESPAEGDGGERPRVGVQRARLVALNMAYAGQPRDEAEQELRKLGVTGDLDEILDEAYERAGRAD